MIVPHNLGLLVNTYDSQIVVSIRLPRLEAMFKTSDYVWNVCSGRYAEFAINLNSQGYGVFGMDWIGILDTQRFTLLKS